MIKKVVLIGPPGAGKSTIGKALAKELGTEFVDSDSEIERVVGKKISDIFVEEGEAVFRKTEVEIVSAILDKFELQ
jgi:shikimate kinase